MKLLSLDREHLEFENDNLKEDLLELRPFVKKVALVIPQQSLRKTLKRVFKDINGLSPKMVISPNEAAKENYDLLIVDEVHRLRRRVNLVNWHIHDQNNKRLNLPKEATELDWIVRSSKSQLLFYDENQSIKPTDIKPDYVKEILKNTKNKVCKYDLTSQFRVLAGEDYIIYIRDLLRCNLTGKKSFERYDFKLVENINNFKKIIIEKDEKFGLARFVAGYAWEWKRKKVDYSYDIEIAGSKFKWNTNSMDWVNSKNSRTEVGCIHTIQGYDLNYAGVIIGPEISYDEFSNKIVINPDKYFDRNGKAGLKDKKDELKKYILNIYGVLLTRGIRGTYIYVCDDKLKAYLSKYIDYL